MPAHSTRTPHAHHTHTPHAHTTHIDTNIIRTKQTQGFTRSARTGRATLPHFRSCRTSRSASLWCVLPQKCPPPHAAVQAPRSAVWVWHTQSCTMQVISEARQMLGSQRVLRKRVLHKGPTLRGGGRSATDVGGQQSCRPPARTPSAVHGSLPVDPHHMFDTTRAGVRAGARALAWLRPLA